MRKASVFDLSVFNRLLFRPHSSWYLFIPSLNLVILSLSPIFFHGSSLFLSDCSVTRWWSVQSSGTQFEALGAILNQVIPHRERYIYREKEMARARELTKRPEIWFSSHPPHTTHLSRSTPLLNRTDKDKSLFSILSK